MRHAFTLLAGLGLCVAAGAALTGCTGSSADAPATAPTVVTVSTPVEREVTNYQVFTGQTEAVGSVEVRARVWGYIDKVSFKEGVNAEVKKGDVLFEIDRRTYKAQLDQAKAKVTLSEAQLKLKEAEYKRDLSLVKTGAVSQEELERSRAARDSAAAALVAAKADVAGVQINYDDSLVVAAISGRVSRALVREGNLVQGGQTGGTLLTTIVPLEPMYAYFDVDERTMLHIRELIREGKAKDGKDAPVPVYLGLSTEKGYPHEGTVDFVDNQVNPGTGTVKARARFPNKDLLLAPGLNARIRVPIGDPHQALLVTDRAVLSDQGQKVLYLVNDQNEVVSRPVELGALHQGLREVVDGLKPGERVIVNGLQRVRPGVQVEAKLVDMPVPPGAEGTPVARANPPAPAAAGDQKP
jgi:RND family efflux transporter MFP subunit